MSLVAGVAVSGLPFHADKPYSYLIPERLEPFAAPGLRALAPFGAGNKRQEVLLLSVNAVDNVEKLKHLSVILDEEPVLDAQMLKLALLLRDRYFTPCFDVAKAMLPAGLLYRIEERWTLCGEAKDERLTPAAGALVSVLVRMGGSAERRQIEEALDGYNAAAAFRQLSDKGMIMREAGAHRRVGDKTTKRIRLTLGLEDALAYLAENGRRVSALQGAAVSFLAETGGAYLRELKYFTGASAQTASRLVKAGVAELIEEPAYRSKIPLPAENPPEIILNAEQSAAKDGVSELLRSGKSACALLHGITGSGKTAVYISLAREALELGGACIIMVPEIALTPQLMDIFSAHFGERVAILHSALSQGERLDEWKRVKSGAATVVVGTRSAVFAPVSRVKLIVLDEEQDDSYRSDMSPCYHAREVAQYRCAKNGAVLLLGSATPSITTMHNALTGKYKLFTLSKRYNEHALPTVAFADMRAELRRGNSTPISEPLRAELERNINAGEQSIVLINRRGTHKMLVCGECGHTPGCSNCSMSLTHHSANGRLICHMCGYSEIAEEYCAECGGRYVPLGAGTQKVVEVLHGLFPDCEILRMDTDTTGGKGAHEKLLNRFSTEKIPILVGTQMVSKGLNLRNVTLVGVLNADAALYVDDYRAAERAFQLITQVIGRAGRGEKPGRALIQCFSPSHPLLLAAAAQDYDSFYRGEVSLRESLMLPPFSVLVTLTISGTVMEDALMAARRMRLCVDESKITLHKVFGPAMAPVFRVNGRYRYTVALQAQPGAALRTFVADILVWFGREKRFKGLRCDARLE